MPYLIRKYSRAKWRGVDFHKPQNAPADAITNCLKTTDNTLSVWEIDSPDKPDEGVLAIAGSLDHIAAIDIIILNEDDIKDADISVESSEGDTTVTDLKETHKDIVNLTYYTLGKINDLMVTSLKNKLCKRYTAGELKKILKKALNEKRIHWENLSPGLQKICKKLLEGEEYHAQRT